MAITRLIDISKYQGLPDWAQVATTGYKAALTRMSIGKNTPDQFGRQNLRGILDHMPVAGAYGVVGTADPVTDGAKFFLDEVAAVTDPHNILIMLDAENFNDGSHPTIKQVDLYAAQIHSELGRWPIAYVPGWWMNRYGYSPAGRGLAECPWAQSHYLASPWPDDKLLANKPTNLMGFKSLAWLQYTSSASVAGIAGNVDANAFYGSLNELEATLIGEDVPISDSEWTKLEGLFDKYSRWTARWVDHGDNTVQGTGNNLANVRGDIAELKALLPTAGSDPVAIAEVVVTVLGPALSAAVATELQNAARKVAA